MVLRPVRVRPKLKRNGLNIRPTLFRKLVRKFGYEDAKLQWGWIQREALSPSGRTMGASEERRRSTAEIVYRLLRDEPVAYILGTQPFGHLLLRVQKPVLIPRPETEEWTLELVRRLKNGEAAAARPVDGSRMYKVLDLCTGSGCIPLLLRDELTGRDETGGVRVRVRVHAVDVSEEAVELARENAERLLGREPVHCHRFQTSPSPSTAQSPSLASSVDQSAFHIHQMDVFHPSFASWLRTCGPFDVVTCNPPYIPEREWRQLEISVRGFEDRRALDGGADGLRFYRRISDLLAEGPGLKKGGWLAMEFGMSQARDVKAILEGHKKRFRDVEIWTDAFGVERAVFCQASDDS